jgi:GTP-binding protein Era
MQPKTDLYSGFVAFVGLPNAGKSTLINALIGRKVTIVSRKRQTTRMRIMAALSELPYQMVFVDTPGFFKAKTQFEKAMFISIQEGIQDADIIALIVDARRKEAFQDNKEFISILKDSQKPILVVLNKSDLIPRQEILHLTKQFSEILPQSDFFLTSAIRETGIKELKENLKQKLPRGPWYFSEEVSSSISERLLAAELTREQVFNQIHDEIPYQIFVDTDKFEEMKNGECLIYQTLYVQHKRHVGMILGTKGDVIKKINKAARKEMERTFKKVCHLYLHVKVDSNWQTKKSFYESIGLKF